MVTAGAVDTAVEDTTVQAVAVDMTVGAAVDMTAVGAAVDTTAAGAAVDTTAAGAAVDTTAAGAAVDTTAAGAAVDTTAAGAAVDTTAAGAAAGAGGAWAWAATAACRQARLGQAGGPGAGAAAGAASCLPTATGPALPGRLLAQMAPSARAGPRRAARAAHPLTLPSPGMGRCGNTNFARRTECNRCGAPRPAGVGLPRGMGPNGRGQRQLDPEKPRSEMPTSKPRPSPQNGDWACPTCMNMNWARRESCNQCQTKRPGQVDDKREGRAGTRPAPARALLLCRVGGSA